MNKTRTSRYTYVPIISFEKAQESYFIFDGSVHSVAECDSEVFRTAVRDARYKRFDNPATENLINRPDSDIVTRWYILNELCRLNSSIKLYPSEEKAMHRLPTHN